MRASALFLLFTCLSLHYSIAMDTITLTNSIQDPQSIVSSGQTYRLGFFSLVNSTNRYVGIIMNVTPVIVIWVANRDRPLSDSAGMLAISEDGNLVVLNGNKNVLWSSNVSNPSGNGNSSAQLLDSWNLVLKEMGNANGTIIWESFLSPTDHFVPKMKIGIAQGSIQQLISWISPSDPSNGSLTFGLDPLRIPEGFVWNNGQPYWRSGPWDGNVFVGVPGMTTTYKNGLHVTNDNFGSVYAIYGDEGESNVTYNILTSNGTFLQMAYDGAGNPRVQWSSSQSDCDVYGKCGPFGLCNPRSPSICSCPRGFEPSDKFEWRRGNWTGGCQRKALLQCQRNNSARRDGFLKLENIKLPDLCYVVEFREWHTIEECENMCVNNCTCGAYAYNKGIGCMHWSGSLLDMQQFSFDGADFFLRLSSSELGKKFFMP